MTSKEISQKKSVCWMVELVTILILRWLRVTHPFSLTKDHHNWLYARLPYINTSELSKLVWFCCLDNEQHNPIQFIAIVDLITHGLHIHLRLNTGTNMYYKTCCLLLIFEILHLRVSKHIFMSLNSHYWVSDHLFHVGLFKIAATNPIPQLRYADDTVLIQNNLTGLE